MKKIILGLTLFSSLWIKAQTQVEDLSTGVVNGSTALQAIGTNDDTWMVQLPGGGPFYDVRVSDGSLINAPTSYFPNQGCARWVSRYIDNVPGSSTFGKLIYGPAGNYRYRMTFTTSGTITSATLNFNFAGADNSMEEIYINGHYHNLSTYSITMSSLKTLTMTIPVTDIVSGTNTVDIIVNNQASSYNGMYICGNLTLQRCDPALTASLSGMNGFCGSGALSFVGGSSSNLVTAHFWEIVEADAMGNVIPGGFSWSNWYTGVPGAFTFPASINAPCGKYYKIKLAVQNSCVVWNEATKLIYVGCSPVIKLGKYNANICSGTEVSLVATITGGSGNYTMDWTPISPAGPSIYNGIPASVMVTPTTTTTYMVTITDNVSGCVSTATRTYYVTNNNPSFSFSKNTSNPNYFTVAATPNDLSTPSQPGFGYVWKVEELDANGNTVFIIDNSSCWWTFNPPTVIDNNFNGFDHVTNSYSGNVTLSNCSSPTAGKFLYGRTYRITRGTWNDFCDWAQYSEMIIPVRSVDGTLSVVFMEDKNAPEISYLKNNTGVHASYSKEQISVYPNPGKGEFIIEMSQESNYSVEVYDAFGRKVRSFGNMGLRTAFDLSGERRGIYMVNIISGGNKINKKIILE